MIVNRRTVCILGDSAAASALASNGAHALPYLMTQLDNRIVGNSVARGGWCVSGGDHIHVEAVMRQGPRFTFVFAGGNDWIRSLPLGPFAAAYADHLLRLTSLPPVMGIRATTIAVCPYWFGQWEEWDNELGYSMDHYRCLIYQAAVNAGVRFVDAREAIGPGDVHLLSGDQLHPNNDGYAALAALFVRVFQTELEGGST